MAQLRGTGYGIGQPNPFSGSSPDTKESGGALDAIRQQTSKIEDLLDTYSEPVKPCVLLPPPVYFGMAHADPLDTCLPLAAS